MCSSSAHIIILANCVLKANKVRLLRKKKHVSTVQGTAMSKESRPPLANSHPFEERATHTALPQQYLFLQKTALSAPPQRYRSAIHSHHCNQCNRVSEIPSKSSQVVDMDFLNDMVVQTKHDGSKFKQCLGHRKQAMEVSILNHGKESWQLCG